MEENEVRNFRSIWISDVHLGTRGCKAEYLLDFLRSTESENLFLVGDMIDGWRLRRSWYWPQEHNDVVQKLLRKARKGTIVTFIPGNHDEFVRNYLEFSFGDILVCNDTVHVTADGRRLLVIHGDQFDTVVVYAKWLAHLGDHAYNWAMAVNLWLNWARRRLGLRYWSLSAYLKHRVKNAVAYIANFEEAMAEMARRRGVDGVVCGHIHHAELRKIGDILYANDGDWVESCTALVEHFDGRLEVLRWAEVGQLGEAMGREQAIAAEPMHTEAEICALSSLPMPGSPRSMAWSVPSAP
jgi:UDP-2,3-diacylglucosamine pyrophosphatase LpxH